MRTLASAAVATGVALAAVLGVSGGAAYAQAPSEQGWWTATNPGLSSLGVNSPVQPPGQPDVPPNGLLVEGGPNQTSPTAYAGLVYELPDGANATTLTLSVAAGSATTPNTVLQICPLNQPTFNPEQGGPTSDAPAYTCTNQVTASPSSNGASYQFNVAALAHQGNLAVAVLPTSPTDRVVLSQPDTNSLAVQGGESGTIGTSAPAVPTSSPFTSATPGSGTPFSAAQGSPSSGIGTAVNPPSTATSGQSPSLAPTGGAAAQPQASIRLPAATIGSATIPAKPVAVAIVILAVLAGAAAWSGAGRAAIRAATNPTIKGSSQS